MAHDDRKVCVGVVGAPHGVRGEVRIRSYTADPLAVAAYGPLTTADGRRLVIRKARLAKDMVIALLEGITDRDGAEALKNERLYVDRDRLPEADEDEFYHADLIGLSARDEAGVEIGTVTSVMDFGGGDLLEIRLAGSRRTALVPFTKTVVPAVDIAGGYVVIDAPDGLLSEARQDREGEEDGQ